MKIQTCHSCRTFLNVLLFFKTLLSSLNYIHKYAQVMKSGEIIIIFNWNKRILMKLLI